MSDYSLYKGFWFVPSITSAKVETFSSLSESNYELFNNVDIFEIDGGSLICLQNDVSLNGIHDLRVSGQGGEVFIQSQTYENGLDILEGRPTWMFGVTPIFQFLDSVNVNVNKTLFPPELGAIGDFSQRCDTGKYGPDAFFDFTPNAIISIMGVRVFMSITGMAHILIIDAKEMTDYTRVHSEKMITTETYSISGAIKNILEWKESFNEPWSNRDRPALIANDFLNLLGISQQAQKDVWETESLTYLGRFMSGETDYSEKTVESGIIPHSLKKDVLRVLRYKTLSSLSMHHPDAPPIDNDLLSQEKKYINEEVYRFVINNNIDTSIFNARSLRDSVRWGLDGFKVSHNEIELLEKYVGYSHG
jgi:hypothetical protein